MTVIAIKRYMQKKKVLRLTPTAGLHFTHELLEEIKNMGVHITFLTLHVGLGTFRPVSVENIEKHDMHSEYYQVSKETADLINNVKNKAVELLLLVQPLQEH